MIFPEASTGKSESVKAEIILKFKTHFFLKTPSNDPGDTPPAKGTYNRKTPRVIRDRGVCILREKKLQFRFGGENE